MKNLAIGAVQVSVLFQGYATILGVVWLAAGVLPISLRDVGNYRTHKDPMQVVSRSK